MLFAVVIVLVGAISLQSFKESLNEVLVSDQKALLSRIAEDLDATVVRLRGALVASAKTVTAADVVSSDAAQRFLDANTGLTALFDRSTFLMSLQGRIIAEHPWLPHRRGEDLSFRDYIYKTLATRAPVMSEPFVTTKKDRHVVLVLAVPVFAPTGELMAVHTGSMGLSQPGILSNIYTTIIGRSGYLFLAAKDGRLIMHPDKARLLQRAYPAGVNPLFERALRGYEGTGVTFDSRGKRSLITYKRIPSTDWLIAAVYPEDEAFAAYYTLVWRLSIILAMAGAIAVVSVWFFTREMVRKLETTNSDLEQMRADATNKLQSRSQFFQEASHDFKQRLHAMQLLVHATLQGTPPDAQSLLSTVSSAVVSMKEYVTHFLEFTQLETSANQPALSTVRLQKLFQKLEIEFEDVALEKGVDLKIRVTDISIKTDENMLLRIIENLVSNAIKFGRGKVLIGVRKSSNGMSIEIWDNGPGIPESQKSLIFEAFYRGNLEYGNRDGVGLGLAIVKRLATCLECKVQINSQEGRSNVVKIIIPPHYVVLHQDA